MANVRFHTPFGFLLQSVIDLSTRETTGGDCKRKHRAFGSLIVRKKEVEGIVTYEQDIADSMDENLYGFTLRDIRSP